MRLIIEGAREVMLFYARKSRAGLQRVLNPMGSMYASNGPYRDRESHYEVRIQR